MTKSSSFNYLYKEIKRFSAYDEKGACHTVVERVKINQKTDASGRVVGSKRGSSHFYSATTGDALIKNSVGNLVDRNNVCCINLTCSKI